MNPVRKRASDTGVVLEQPGALKRIAAVAAVYKGGGGPEDWVVETIDSTGDDGICVTVFVGPDAKERAIEYASEKYSGLRLHDPSQSTYR